MSLSWRGCLVLPPVLYWGGGVGHLCLRGFGVGRSCLNISVGPLLSWRGSGLGRFVALLVCCSEASGSSESTILAGLLFGGETSMSKSSSPDSLISEETCMSWKP